MLQHKKNPAKCPGPECGGCSAAECYADGGEVKTPKPTGTNTTGATKLGQGWAAAGFAHGGYVKGVHESFGEKEGQSRAGAYARSAHESKKTNHLNGAGEHYSNKSAKDLHKEKLHESRSMPSPNLKGLAHGGEVDAPHDDDSEIHSMLGKEMMSAIESKDHKRIMDGIEACVLSAMNKHKE